MQGHSGCPGSEGSRGERRDGYARTARRTPRTSHEPNEPTGQRKAVRARCITLSHSGRILHVTAVITNLNFTPKNKRYVNGALPPFTPSIRAAFPHLPLRALHICHNTACSINRTHNARGGGGSGSAAARCEACGGRACCVLCANGGEVVRSTARGAAGAGVKGPAIQPVRA